MNQMLSYLSSLAKTIRANPALASSVALVLATLGARFGLGLDATQLTTVISWLAVSQGTLVHVSTTPAKAVQHGDHEKPGAVS